MAGMMKVERVECRECGEGFVRVIGSERSRCLGCITREIERKVVWAWMRDEKCQRRIKKL